MQVQVDDKDILPVLNHVKIRVDEYQWLTVTHEGVIVDVIQDGEVLDTMSITHQELLEEEERCTRLRGYPHIVLHEGEPAIEGTSITVAHLWSVKCSRMFGRSGASVEKIRAMYPDVPPARILSALAFAFDNQDFFDTVQRDKHQTVYQFNSRCLDEVQVEKGKESR